MPRLFNQSIGVTEARWKNIANPAVSFFSFLLHFCRVEYEISVRLRSARNDSLFRFYFLFLDLQFSPRGHEIRVSIGAAHTTRRPWIVYAAHVINGATASNIITSELLYSSNIIKRVARGRFRRRRQSFNRHGRAGGTRFIDTEKEKTLDLHNLEFNL